MSLVQEEHIFMDGMRKRSNFISFHVIAQLLQNHFFLFFKVFKKLFIFREGKEKERERNINVWLPLACPPLGPGPNPGMCSRLGIEPVTLWFAGWHSIH